MIKKHPPGLIAIVIYKGFVALLLTATSIVLLLALKKHDTLVVFSESYILEGKREVIEWLLEKIINIKPQTLKFSGIATAIYAVVTAIEAIGLWYEKTWAKILVIGLVGISIPPEIYELIKGVTIFKFLVFIVNLAVLSYLVKHFYKH
ncbi:DUF2127 domain-containing protein [Anabaena cylindrica FACHB-243]|uniref:DUF2127 domain-containing protein n=1 Tax=Anabaena cylindrica (strain ATCC 27899 / PCC 7122) TaxID=272123 RepID=K9ZRE1_ANACC|nr:MULTISPECIES: DUF2127 domain-containing protein [Anabaena]AFZ61117.1 hypothetical protein Anacy_5822 [Anabaena cylindrica PCC 7122]MBD2421591.1 DUF2127 domain-containing protein [Anabaena cylindrica FACHB-243]MBY5280510.1 DUF2127 domain-containing protein [Anabaena sp. CCAP 1446/1C]MBY5308099.1 DUF2127 domain-containing protein [Anabaena sp. CCAP 1446/1C]MCM2405508.1 DUF2127 domain-containing protein [Anabaena sp. CCAP 1446/1C]